MGDLKFCYDWPVDPVTHQPPLDLSCLEEDGFMEVSREIFQSSTPPATVRENKSRLAKSQRVIEEVKDEANEEVK